MLSSPPSGCNRQLDKLVLDEGIRRAMIHGIVVASFCCECFELNRTTKVKRADIQERVKELEKLTKF